MTILKATLGALTLALVLLGGLSLPALAQNNAGIDFGDNSSERANDGKCDDPRFIGSGAAPERVKTNRFNDATDCRTAYEAGTVTLKNGAPPPATTTAEINFGDDTSRWSNDGECDDPRFVGTGVANNNVADDIKRDAADCRSAVLAGTARYIGGVDAGNPNADRIIGAIEDLSVNAEKVIIALLTGDGRDLSASNMTFLGGLATGMLEDCRVFDDAGKTVALTAFATQTSTNAAMGLNYMAPLDEIWGNQASAMSVYTVGVQTGRNVPCVTGVSDDLGEAILEVASGSKSASESTFLETCPSGPLNSSQCSCLAQVAMSLMPDIHSRPYSQSLVYGLMERNPLVGIQIMGACGIMNY